MKKLLVLGVLFISFSNLLATERYYVYPGKIGDLVFETKSDGVEYYHYDIKCINNGRLGRVWKDNQAGRILYVTDMQNNIKTRVIKNANYDYREKLPMIMNEYCQ